MPLSPDHEQIRDAVRAFVAQEVTPHAAAWDRDATFPKQPDGNRLQPRLRVGLTVEVSWSTGYEKSSMI